MKYCRMYKSPVGLIGLLTDGKALNAAWPEKNVEEIGLRETEGEVPKEAEAIFVLAAEWLDRYFAGEKLDNPKLICSTPERKTGGAGARAAAEYTLTIGRKTLVLRPEGTEFRQQVWKKLCEIPYGETTTYGDIAAAIAKERGIKKMSARAVGGSVGSNPLAIMIPCHRVVGAGGSLTGYGGGMPMKVRLLELEGLDMNDYIIPTKGTRL